MPENQKKLHNLLAGRIRENGPISVAEYMALAVEAYYAGRDPFGTEGDFTTAPEVSQMFGEMIGAWLVDAWLQMGRPENVKLVELGPGRGTLAADVMRTISAWPDFKSTVTLHLVETSPLLRERQAVALKEYRAGWYDSFSEVPEGICFVIANEFFDALPVHQFEKAGEEWRERCVGYDADKDAFFYTTVPLDFDITGMMPEAFLNAPSGSIFEISPTSLGILEEISARIARSGGAGLIIDYGHVEAGLGDTLQAVSKHQYSDVLQSPGEKDITAHVDFGTLATVARQHVTVSGPITQGQFLIALGIEARAQKLGENASDKQRQDIMSALCRLVAPQEMGRLFKVMALTPQEAIIVPAGFGEHGHEASDD